MIIASLLKTPLCSLGLGSAFFAKLQYDILTKTSSSFKCEHQIRRPPDVIYNLSKQPNKSGLQDFPSLANIGTLRQLMSKNWDCEMRDAPKKWDSKICEIQQKFCETRLVLKDYNFTTSILILLLTICQTPCAYLLLVQV